MQKVCTNCCRVCLNKDNLSDIFGVVPISEKIMRCASVQVSIDDMLPKKLCGKCVDYLHISYVFRTVCEATDENLRKMTLFNVEMCTKNIKLNAETLLNFPPTDLKNTPEQKTEKIVAQKAEVGRHIAKKNAGQHPRRYKPPGDAGKTTPLIKDEFEEDDIEYVLASDLPDALFEETVITEGTRNTPLIANEDQLEDEVVEATRKSQRNLEKRKYVIIKDKTKKTQLKRKASRKFKQHEENDVKGFTCEGCSKTFPYRSRLIRHLASHTGIKKYSCQICKKEFINNYNLSVHLRSHTGVFPLKCNTCGKGFTSPSILSRHIRSHTGELPYQCRYCPKKFPHSSTLQLHEKMHVNRPTYTCDVCYKMFSYKNSLEAHKKAHAGIKPYVCNVCSKAFSRKSSLLRHASCKTRKCNAKAHVKLKCEMCDLEFNSNARLMLHCKKYHFRCDQCGNKFNTRMLLIKHLQKHLLKEQKV